MARSTRLSRASRMARSSGISGAFVLKDDEDLVADLDFEGELFAVLVGLAGAQGNDFSRLRLFFCGVRDDDPTADFFLFGNELYEDPFSDRSDVCFA